MRRDLVVRLPPSRLSSRKHRPPGGQAQANNQADTSRGGTYRRLLAGARGAAPGQLPYEDAEHASISPPLANDVSHKFWKHLLYNPKMINLKMIPSRVALVALAQRRQTCRRHRALATLPLRVGESARVSTSLTPAWEGLLDAVARVNSGGHTL